MSNDVIQRFRRDLRANNSQGLKAFSSLLLNPAILTIGLHRIAALVYPHTLLGKIAALVLWRVGVILTSCHISPKASIGGGLFLPHPTAIVIGEGIKIGENVSIYQSVTLGTSSPGSDQYPKIEDDVVIYAGAVVVGSVTVGKGAVIGANSFVNKDVPAGTLFAGVPARRIAKSAPEQ